MRGIQTHNKTLWHDYVIHELKMIEAIRQAYKTCFDGPFKYVLVVETPDADMAKRIENLFLKEHSDNRLLRKNGSKCELMNMSLHAIIASVNIIITEHFPGHKIDTSPDYFEDERYESDDED